MKEINMVKSLKILARLSGIAGLAGLAFLAVSSSAFAAGSTPAALKKGKALFAENCEVCHRADAIGEPGVAPSLTNPELLALASDKYFAGTIRDGREDTGMPPFAHLGRGNIRAIVAFLRSHAVGPNMAAEVDSQADAHGDPRLGQQWYDNICSTCHGVEGDGRGPRAYFINPKPRNFLHTASRASYNRPTLFTAIGKGKLRSEMPAWEKVFNDQQIADVSEFIFKSFISP